MYSLRKCEKGNEPYTNLELHWKTNIYNYSISDRNLWIPINSTGSLHPHSKRIYATKIIHLSPSPYVQMHISVRGSRKLTRNIPRFALVEVNFNHERAFPTFILVCQVITDEFFISRMKPETWRQFCLHRPQTAHFRERARNIGWERVSNVKYEIPTKNPWWLMVIVYIQHVCKICTRKNI